MAPWADAVFAIDKAWWDTYINSVYQNFEGMKIIGNPCPTGYNLTSVTNLGCHGNSGIGAIALAILGGAEKVILLGYDCKVTNGKTHWHGKHPSHLADARRIDEWPALFEQFARNVTIPVVNATVDTALKAFPRVKLEDVL